MSGLDHISLNPNRDAPLVMPWPAPQIGVAMLSFSTPEQWLEFVSSFDLHPAVPLIVSAKYLRAQKLYYLAWEDFDIVKAGELMALTALELALKDRYGKKDLSVLLKHMVEVDGLTDSDVPLVRRCGGSAVKRLTGEVRPTLADIRNSLAHGDPFDGLPQAGLIEMVRDLIEYAYRDMIRHYTPGPSLF